MGELCEQQENIKNLCGYLAWKLEKRGTTLSGTEPDKEKVLVGEQAFSFEGTEFAVPVRNPAETLNLQSDRGHW